ncbi:ABC transporter permease [Enterobacter roggenkampii]|uniref:ABC transporter permease n=1 Tax=Enterobacter roggenkampii TaxID=1812935 RepID=UPI00079797F3|nr:ABC transporter permease [Enterobacter roggenkampii]MBA7744965.1 ABC transporter permease [Enterobacter roggenkampii]MBT2030133.1 ABC transporter permease [Enterobacter roggenkampii]MBT2034664.1 ABC transporter permease [Enterobacter roggenkampii]MCM7635863.1 ABC transporter permease [Enterobacter roggenkampii]MCM7757326.1 ABC transporter permease [Enterobacter roggenkampii]
MNSFINEIIEYRQVLRQLIHQQITMRYRRTFFGFLWTLLNPLLNMAIIAVVFSLVMKFQVNEYAIFLFAAMIPWSVFSNSLNQGGGALLANESLFKKIYLPKQLFVISVVISTLVDSLLSTACLFIIALILGAKISAALLFLPVAFLLLVMFSLGVTFILSIVTVYYRDVQYLIGVVLQALYFATPIIYPITAIPEKFHAIFTWNPLVYYIDLFRSPIYFGTLPDAHSLIICSVCSLLSIVCGVIYFRRNDAKVIFRL